MTSSNNASLKIKLLSRNTQFPIADGLCVDISVRTKAKNAFHYHSKPSVDGVICITARELLSSCESDRRAFPMDYISPCGDNFDGIHVSIPSLLSTERAISAFRSMKTHYSYPPGYETSLTSHLEWLKNHDISDVDVKVESMNNLSQAIRSCCT